MDAGFHVAWDGDAAHDPRSRFWKLWELHQETLYKICLKQLKGDEEAAADALSAVMVKSLETISINAPKITNLQSWLCRMAYNFCNDIHRKNTIQSKGGLHRRVMGSFDNGPEPDPEELLSRRENDRMVRKLIKDLPTHLREAFMLRYHEDLSYRAIGSRLRLSEVAIRKRVQRARAHMKAKIEHLET